MIGWSASSEIECDIIALGSPNVYQRLPIRAYFTPERRMNRSELDLHGGGKDILQFGRPEVDVTLRLSRVDRATAEALEEIAERELPCLIYPHVPGTIQAFWPGYNGLGGWPSALTYSQAGLGSTSRKAYLIKADPGRGVAYVLTDITAPIHLSGLRTRDGIEAAFPLGRGWLAFGDLNNHVPNSLFGDITSYEPDDWDWNGTPGTDGGVITTGWLGLPALWGWGTASRWLSDAAGCGAAKEFSLSFAYRTDGVVTTTISFDAGL